MMVPALPLGGCNFGGHGDRRRSPWGQNMDLFRKSRTLAAVQRAGKRRVPLSEFIYVQREKKKTQSE